MTTREISLNNPCGLKKVPPIKWQGLAADQPDATLCKFISPEMGIRAPVKNLMTYEARGIDTTRQIISAWAPSDPTGDRNPTEQYIANVCGWCNFGADEPLDLDRADTMRPLIKAIIRQENGEQPYSDAVINNAMRLAGIADVLPEPVMASKTSQGVSITTVGAGVAAATETARQLSEVQADVDQLSGFLHWALAYGPWLAVAFVLAGVSLAFYDHMRKRARLGV